MQLEYLRYFAELERCRSISQAAENLFVSSQGLGKAIRALEGERGYKLIERSSKGVALTFSGEVFLKHAKAMLVEYQDAVVEMSGSDEGESAGQTGLPWIITPYIMNSATALMGGVTDSYSKYNMVELPFNQAIDKLERDDAYYAVTCELFPESQDTIARRNLVFVSWFLVRPGIIWSGECPVRDPEGATFSEIDHLPKAVLSDKSIDHFYRSRLGNEVFSNVRFSAGSWHPLIEFVQTQRAVGLFDTFALESLRRSGDGRIDRLHFTPLHEPDLSFAVGFLYSREKGMPDAYRAHLNLTKIAYTGCY